VAQRFLNKAEPFLRAAPAADGAAQCHQRPASVGKLGPFVASQGRLLVDDGAQEMLRADQIALFHDQTAAVVAHMAGQTPRPGRRPQRGQRAKGFRDVLQSAPVILVAQTQACRVVGGPRDAGDVFALPEVAQALLAQAQGWTQVVLGKKYPGQPETTHRARPLRNLGVLRETPFQECAPFAQMTPELPKEEEFAAELEERSHRPGGAIPRERRQQIRVFSFQLVQNVLSIR
jgi:hypothetical protein